MKLVCVGDCGIDHYLPSGRLLAGGITANFARHAVRVFSPDDEIHVVSAIGNEPDAAGLVLRAFEKSGIQCHIAELPGHTPVQFIHVEPDGERSFVRYDEGVLGSYRIGEKTAKIIQTADLLVAPVFRQILDMFDSLIRIPVKGRVAVDFADFAQHPDFVHLESCLDRIDIAFFGLSLRDKGHIEKLATLAERWHKLFVVTLGVDGSRAFLGHTRFRQQAVPVGKVIDTTGAGDAFAAAFLATFVRGGDIPLSLQRAATLASLVVQRLGAVAD
jgi:sugar/nucleoside kinase (ribokinase family)